MASAAIAIEGGFRDPVFQSQSVFRALMDAMARPATILPVGRFVAPPAPLTVTAGAVLCALADADSAVWLDGRLAESEPVRAWIAFQTGAPIVPEPAAAQFAVVADPQSMPPLPAFAQGSQEYPDRSTTIVLQVEGFNGDSELVFEGPGIAGTATIAPSALPAEFAAQWRANRARFPRGVDLAFAGDGALACLPRTARLRG